MSLSVVVVAYQRPLLLRALIASWQAQTYRDWGMLVLHDGPPGGEMPVGDPRQSDAEYDWLKRLIWEIGDPRIGEDHGDERQGAFGHPLRAEGIKRATGDWLLITNDDNYYAPVFAERMMARTAPDVACVLCDMVHNHPRCDYLGRGGKETHYGVLVTKPQVQFADIGCFIVPTAIAKQVGFPWRDHDGDGRYLVECIRAGRKAGRGQVVKVPEVLFVHN